MKRQTLKQKLQKYLSEKEERFYTLARICGWAHVKVKSFVEVEGNYEVLCDVTFAEEGASQTQYDVEETIPVGAIR